MLCPCGGKLRHLRTVDVDDDNRVMIRYRLCERCGKVSEWEDRYIKTVIVNRRPNKILPAT